MNRVQLAAQLLRAGFRLIPTNGKVATVEAGAFGKDAPDATWGAEHFADGEIGVLCGPCPALGDDWLICLDVDGDPQKAAPLRDLLSELPPTLTSHRGRHLFFRVSASDAPRLQQWGDVFRTKAATGAALDLKWNGGYACEQGDWDGPVDPARIAPLPAPVLERIVTARGGDTPTTPAAPPPDPTDLVAAGLDPAQVLADAAEWLLEAAPLPTDGTGGGTLMVVIGGLMVGFGLDGTEAAELAEAFYYPRAWPGEEVDHAGLQRKIDEIDRHGSQTFEPLQLAIAARNTRALAALEAELDGGIPESERIDETPKASPKRLVRVSAAELAKPIEDVNWLCERMALAPGRPCLFVAKPGVGKTLAVQELALCVAAGIPAFGQFPVRQGRVLHIDLDQGGHSTQARYQQLAAGHGLDFATLPLDCVFQDFQLTKLDGSFAGAVVDPEQVRLLRDESRGHALVVVDALFSVSMGMDEHRPEIGHVVQAFRHVSDALAKEGGVPPTFLIVHHAGHAGDTRARGSSAILGAAGVTWNIERRPDDPRAVWSIGKNSVLSLERQPNFATCVEKVPGVWIRVGKHEWPAAKVVIAPEPEDGDENLGAKGAARFEQDMRTVLEAVRAWPGITKRTLQNKVKGCRRTDAQTVIDKLVEGAPECLGEQIWEYETSKGFYYFADPAETRILRALEERPANDAVLRVVTKLPASVVADTCQMLAAQNVLILDTLLPEPKWDLVSRARPGRK